MKGSHYAANCSGFHQGFYIHSLVPKSQGPKGAKDIIDELKGSSKSFTAAQGLRRYLPGHPQDQQMRCLWPFGRAPCVTCCQWILATTSGPWSDHLPGSAPTTRPEGHPQQDVDPSYLPSCPRAEAPLLVLDAHQASLGSWRQSTERAGMRPIVIHNKGPLHTTDPTDHSKHLAPRARIPTEERARSRRAPLKHLLLSLWPRRTIPLRRSP